jgi:hypothetical protein
MDPPGVGDNAQFVKRPFELLAAIGMKWLWEGVAEEEAERWLLLLLEEEEGA